MNRDFNGKTSIMVIGSLFVLIASAFYLLMVSGGKVKESGWRDLFTKTYMTDQNNKNTDTDNAYAKGNKNNAKNKAAVVKSFDGMEVHFLDVGDADCSYIRCGENNILIDAGDREPKGFVVDYLNRQGVEKLDLVVATHPHRDHIGQMSDVLENFKVDKFIEPDVPDEAIPTSVTYDKMLQTIARQGVDTELVTDGYNISVGDLNIEVVGPVFQDNRNLNNNSIVLRITYKDVKFLFAGDAETGEEKDIINGGAEIKADVLKVGHHGSSTSTTLKFLKAIEPKYAVISVSAEKYQVSKSKVASKLKKFCGENHVYVTGNDGTVVISTDGKNIDVSKETLVRKRETAVSKNETSINKRETGVNRNETAVNNRKTTVNKNETAVDKVA